MQEELASKENKFSRLRTLSDILILLIVAFGVKALAEPLSWRFSSVPGAVAGLITATLLLRLRNERWADIGLKGPKTILGFLTLPVLAIIVFVFAIGIGAGTAIALNSVIGPPPASADNRFGDIQGNLPVFLMWVAIGWIVGGFAEEMVFRGFLITRFEQFFRGKKSIAGFRPSLIISIIMPAVIFGWAHYYYRGLHGAIAISVIGVVLGAFYILFGRRLWPLIIAHGSIDTLSFLARYLDADW